MMTDPIADMLTRIRNAGLARHDRTEMPASRMKAAVAEILAAIGEDPSRPGLVDTPRRVAEAYADFFSGVGADPLAVLSDALEGESGELVIVRDIQFRSICEHHLLPFLGVAHVAYAPGARIVGLGRLAELVTLLASRPQLQERLTDVSTHLLFFTLELNRLDVAVVPERQGDRIVGSLGLKLVKQPLRLPGERTLPILPLAVPGTFTYLIPEGLEVSPGMRVAVPFGRGRKLYGAVVFRVHGDAPQYRSRPLLSVLDPAPIVLPEQLKLWERIASYYLCTLGEVMIGGTFANIRIRNKMLDGVEGGYTKGPDGAQTSIYDASMAYQEAGVPLIVIGGIEYGAGSSRDWAANGTNLLGVKAVIAESFERIHRSNLVGMGVIPFEFTNGDNRKTLGLKGDEILSIGGLAGSLKPLSLVPLTIKYANGTEKTVPIKCRIDTEVEIEYVEHGGVLHYVLRNLAQS